MNYKLDQGKPRLDLVPPAIIEAVGTIRTYGVEKYGDGTWHKVEPSRYRAALVRHLCEYLRNPDSTDTESGLPHLWHMACNVAFLCELESDTKPKDNILSPDFWERFKAGNLAVNCNTAAEGLEFITLAHEQGFIWSWSPSKFTMWQDKPTAYTGKNGFLEYAHTEWYIRYNYEMVNFSEIKGGN